jgi:hypothetical protein
MESYAGEGNDTLRGREGPLRVTNPAPRDPLFATIIEAAGQVGIRHNPDYNGARQEGIAMSQATIAGGRRMSTVRCYLDPVRNRRNLQAPYRWFCRLGLEGEVPDRPRPCRHCRCRGEPRDPEGGGPASASIPNGWPPTPPIPMARDRCSPGVAPKPTADTCGAG